MTITWLGHACFMLESGGYRLLVDPYRDVPGLRNTAAEAEAVYCSHGHGDHAYTQELTLTRGRTSPFTVEEIPTCHDEAGGSLRGGNTVRCFAAEGLRVVHLGDLGHQLSAQQLAAIGRCDALMVPVGGTYTVDAAGAKAVADAVGARVVIPMHYRRGAVGYGNIGTVEDFTALCAPELVREYDGSALELTADTPRQVAVLRPFSLL